MIAVRLVHKPFAWWWWWPPWGIGSTISGSHILHYYRIGLIVIFVERR